MSLIDHRVPPDDSMSDEQLMQYETHFAVPQPFKDKAQFILHKKAIERSEKSTIKLWYEKPYITIPIGILVGLFVAYLTHIFGWNK